MNYYTLINPSDNYTLRAPELKIAVLAAVLVGGGHYGLDDENDNEVMPCFIITGLEEWIQSQFGQSLTELLDVNLLAIAECLESFAICSVKDRKLWDMAVEAMPEPARSAWLAEWHDQQRSSMNDIGGRAKYYAGKLRAKALVVSN